MAWCTLYKNEHRIFKTVEAIIKRGLRKKEEQIRVILHIYMEISQENSLCSYLKQTKMSFLLFTYKIGGGQNRSCLGEFVLGEWGGNG
jgi:hypothetical protein